jgi:hypothetical protein
LPFGTGQLTISLNALPDDQAAASVRVVRDGIDHLGRSCRVDPTAIWVNGSAYECAELPPGEYEIEAAAFGDVTPVVNCLVGSEHTVRPTPSIAPIDAAHVWCHVAALPPGLRVNVSTNTIGPALDGSFTTEGRIEPEDVIVRSPDGVDVDVTCRPVNDGDEWADCSPLPVGRYEVFYPPTPDGERPVVCAPGLDMMNGPGLGRTVDIELKPIDLGGANVYWTCVNELPFDELKARMQIIVEAPPGDATDVVPQLLLNGVDAFPDHCSLVSEYDTWEGGVTYFCEGLEQTVYEVRAPGLYGRQPTFSCLGVGIYDDWLTRPDLSVDQFAYCRIDVNPPGIRLAIVGLEAGRAATVADEVVIVDQDGERVDVDCVGLDEQDEVWVFCFPMELGTYRVPTQEIDGPLVGPFTCNPDLGIGIGPDSSSTAVLADEPAPHGIDPLHWTCHNQEFD